MHPDKHKYITYENTLELADELGLGVSYIDHDDTGRPNTHHILILRDKTEVHICKDTIDANHFLRGYKKALKATRDRSSLRYKVETTYGTDPHPNNTIIKPPITVDYCGNRGLPGRRYFQAVGRAIRPSKKHKAKRKILSLLGRFF